MTQTLLKPREQETATSRKELIFVPTVYHSSPLPKRRGRLYPSLHIGMNAHTSVSSQYTS